MTDRRKPEVELDIILAVSVPEEKQRLQLLIEEQSLPYILHCPKTLKEFDEISTQFEIKLIITDLEYQNGSLVDWLGLWPHPFILLACDGCEHRLDSLLVDETSSFLIRRDDLGHINFIPNMVRKVLGVSTHRSIQNSFLRATERQYMNLVQALPDIIYVLDNDGNFTFINNAVRSLGWEPVELIGKHFSILLYKDDIHKVSREEILPDLRGKVTGNDRSPKLFDERRTGSRMTRGLKMKLKRKPSIGGSIEVSLISYGEVSSIGYSGFQSEQLEGLGTAGIIREIKAEQINGSEKPNVESIFNTDGALQHNEVMHLLNNKLQVLSSLVSLKQNRCDDTESSNYLNEVQVQIYTLSLVYQNMVTVDKNIMISMDSYLDDIIKHLVSSYAGNPWIQDIDLHCDKIVLKEDPAITVSLLVSEVITSFLKLQEIISDGVVPLTITFLINNNIAQLKFRTSEKLFMEFSRLYADEESVLVIKTLVEILNGELFLDKDSLTIFFNIE